MQSTGQTSTQASHPVQPSAWITARILGITLRGLPAREAAAMSFDLGVEEHFDGFVCNREPERSPCETNHTERDRQFRARTFSPRKKVSLRESIIIIGN